MSIDICREWNKRLTADQAQKMYEQAGKLEQEFGEYFTGLSTKSLRVEIFIYCSVTDSHLS